MDCDDRRRLRPSETVYFVRAEVVEAQRQRNRLLSQQFAQLLVGMGLVERDETDDEAIARMESEGGPPS